MVTKNNLYSESDLIRYLKSSDNALCNTIVMDCDLFCGVKVPDVIRNKTVACCIFKNCTFHVLDMSRLELTNCVFVNCKFCDSRILNSYISSNIFYNCSFYNCLFSSTTYDLLIYNTSFVNCYDTCNNGAHLKNIIAVNTIIINGNERKMINSKIFDSLSINKKVGDNVK